MLGMLDALGIYDFAEQCRKRSPDRDTLRTAIDAVAIALSLGQRCVEGVRRIETPTVGQLLRRDGGISASWTLRVLGSFAAESATLFQAKTAASLLERAVSEDNRVWLYVDNHYPESSVMRRCRGAAQDLRQSLFGRRDIAMVVDYRLLRNDSRSLLGRHAGFRTPVRPDRFQNASSTRRFIWRLVFV